jgi:cytochrome c oxidase subunit 3
VHFARQGRRRKLALAIALTIACGTLFLGIKGVEYAAKAEEGLLPGSRFNPVDQVWERQSFQRLHPEAARYAAALRKRVMRPDVVTPKPPREAVAPLLRAGVIGGAAEFAMLPSVPRNAHVFFGLYFLMTGLHALHVVIGVGVWIWLLSRAALSVAAVDYAALYWHLVDVIWIYLFPLLYLSH